MIFRRALKQRISSIASAVWGAITGNIDNQTDLISLIGTITALYRPASENSFGMVKPDNQSITIDSTTHLSASITSSADEKIVALTTPVIDLGQGNCFSYTCSSNTTFSISNAAKCPFTKFRLYLTNGGLYTITWPSNVVWDDGIPAELTDDEDATDVLEFATWDSGQTWGGKVINPMITATPPAGLTDVAGGISLHYKDS